MESKAFSGWQRCGKYQNLKMMRLNPKDFFLGLGKNVPIHEWLRFLWYPCTTSMDPMGKIDWDLGFIPGSFRLLKFFLQPFDMCFCQRRDGCFCQRSQRWWWMFLLGFLGAGGSDLLRFFESITLQIYEYTVELSPFPGCNRHHQDDMKHDQVFLHPKLNYTKPLFATMASCERGTNPK